EVGTTGDAAAVQQEQLREAENAYRVDPTDHQADMKSMLGKKVRVTGTVAERGDLPQAAQHDRNAATGTSGQTSRSPLDIDANDLTKIDASAVSIVAENCSGGALAGAAAGKRSGGKSSTRGKRR